MLFYSNEHDPIHVHGLSGPRACRAEIILSGGHIKDVRFHGVKGRRSLTPRELANFRKVVEHFRVDIVAKWVDYFVMHKPVTPQTITRRLR